jgi:N-acylneuraminate cytidylyltransferase
MKKIAIIPARGGSKRIPRKNVVKIRGIPVLGVLIQNLISFDFFDAIYVSTEDNEIADVAKHFGAVVPQLRDSHLADDITPSEVVIKEFLRVNEDISDQTFVYCIYPHSILLQKSDLITAQSKFQSKEIDYVVSGTKINENHFRHSFTVNNDFVNILLPENNYKRSQDLSTVYLDIGMFYAAKALTWVEAGKDWFNAKTKLVEIPNSRGLDVDTPEDLDTLIKKYLKLL